MIQDSLGLLCDSCVLLNMDTFTDPEQDFLVFMLILLYIHLIDYFLEIPHALFIFGVVITTPVLYGIDDVL